MYIADSSELFGDLKVKAFVGKDWPELATQILARIDALAVRIETGVNKYGETRDPGLEAAGKEIVLDPAQGVQLLNVQCDDAMYGLPYVPYDHDGGPSYDVAFVCTSLGGTGAQMPTVAVTDTGALTVAVDVNDNLTVTINGGVTTLADIAAAMAADADVHAVWTMWVDAGTLLTETADDGLLATQATCNHGQDVEYTLYLTLGGHTLRPYMLRGTDALVDFNGTDYRIYTATIAAFYIPAYAALVGNPVYDWIEGLYGVTGAGLFTGALVARRANTPFWAVWSTSDAIGGSGNWIDPVKDITDVSLLPGPHNVGDRYIDNVGAGTLIATHVYEWDGAAFDDVYTPVAGATTFVELQGDDGMYYRFSGVAWELAGESIGHNSLDDLQGGAVGEYYHLTSLAYTALYGAGTPGTPVGGALPLGTVPMFQSTGVDNSMVPATITLDDPAVAGAWFFQIQASTDTGGAGQLVTVQVDPGGGDMSYRQTGDFVFGGAGVELMGTVIVITCDGLLYSVLPDPDLLGGGDEIPMFVVFGGLGSAVDGDYDPVGGGGVPAPPAKDIEFYRCSVDDSMGATGWVIDHIYGWNATTSTWDDIFATFAMIPDWFGYYDKSTDVSYRYDPMAMPVPAYVVDGVTFVEVFQDTMGAPEGGAGTMNYWNSAGQLLGADMPIAESGPFYGFFPGRNVVITTGTSDLGEITVTGTSVDGTTVVEVILGVPGGGTSIGLKAFATLTSVMSSANLAMMDTCDIEIGVTCAFAADVAGASGPTSAFKWVTTSGLVDDHTKIAVADAETGAADYTLLNTPYPDGATMLTVAIERFRRSEKSSA